MSRLFFFIQEAFRALRRNAAPSTAAIVTTSVTVILLGVLIPIFQTASAKSDEVRGQLNFQVALYADATQAEIDSLGRELEAVSHVKTVEFVSKTQALEELKEDLGKEKARELTSQLSENPLPASYRLTPDDAANLTGIRKAIVSTGPNGERQTISPIVEKIFDRQDESQKIEQVTGALKIVLTVITALLLLASLMLVGNTIRLSIYARRREVEVMRLVGATNWFIRWPFVIEGLIVGMLGAASAVAILWLGKVTVVDPLANDFALVSNLQTIAFIPLIAVLVGAAMAVSALGSGITLRRFLQV
jgi:cell division transport system permease protein